MIKRYRKVFLSIIAILIVIIGIVLVFQWDNIKTIYIAATYTKKQIAVMTENNNQLRDEAVSGLPVRQLTDEEKKDIKNGEISSDQALKNILSSKPEEKDNDTGGNSNSSSSSGVSTSQPPDKTDYNYELANLVGQIYILDAKYSGEVDNLVNSAIAEYKALPADQHTQKSKEKIGLKYLGKANSMEKTCDQQMATIMNQIESVLVKSGGDLSLVDKIKSSYESEKIAKKQYYLAQYS